MPEPQSYTIGWICALDTEYVAARAFLDESHGRIDDIDIRDANDYALGRMGPHNMVIAVLPHWQYGLVNATAVAKDMARTFSNLRFILMVGVGGGVPTTYDIRLGDIVVSSAGYNSGGVFQYDYGHAIQDKSFKTTGYLNQPPMALLAAVNGLKGDHQLMGHGIEDAVEKVFDKFPGLRETYQRPDVGSDRLYKPTFVHGDQDKSCSEVCGDDSSNLVPRNERPKGNKLKIHYGLVASANTLMKDAELRDRLAKEKDVVCFEMEAAGLMNHFPCLVVRGICDYCDMHKNVDWQGYAALAAAAYSRQLLQRIPRGRVEAERKIGEAISEAISEVARTATDTLALVTNLNKHNKQRLSAERRHEIERWLSPPDPSTNYNKALAQRYPGTGRWLFENSSYSRWTEQPASFLWLHGIPGCGKTVLSTTVIENLLVKDDARVKAVLYFYFAFSDVQKQNLHHAIRALASQLYVTGQAEVRSPLDTCFASHRDGQQQPSLDTLCNVFQQMVQQVGELWVVLDGLDECKEEQQRRRELLDWIQNFHAGSGNIHLLVTSRPEQDIQSALEIWAPADSSISLQSELVQDDISSYVCWEVREGRRLDRWRGREDVQQEIEDALTERAHGMFRWVSCQLDTLAKCLHYQAVQKALRSLPTTLNETYSRILAELPESNLRDAKRLLQFLAYSERPLRIDEAVDVLAVDTSSQKTRFDVRNRMPHPMEISKFCASLVITVERDHSDEQYDEQYASGHGQKQRITVLQLAHFSVKEYILSNEVEPTFAEDLREPTARAVIAETCLAYLLELGGRQHIGLCNLYPLAGFAARYWADHAAWHEKRLGTACETVRRLAMDLFNAPHIYQICCLLHRPGEPRNTHYWPREEPTTLYYASVVGLGGCVKDILGEGVGADINAQNAFYGSALQAASVHGYLDIVRLLLEHKADVNAQGGIYGKSALQAASAQGYLDIVRLLLEHKANVNTHSSFCGDNALQAASARGYLDIVRLLLEHKADVNIQSGYQGSNVLRDASARGYIEIVQLLLEYKADVNACNNHSDSALQAASAQGYLDIVRLLLEHKADVNAQGGYFGDSALRAASARGYIEIVRLLLKYKANVNAQGGFYGDNALQAASAGGYFNIVQLLRKQEEEEEEGRRVPRRTGRKRRKLGPI